MCGINGLIGFSDSGKTIHSMNELIKHRGPDAEGEWVQGNVALGHRRLSIIDLSPEANQPFLKDHLAIVYNGEIYNFKELKKELIGKGASFRTGSDTEVILELFRLYGEESFSRLIGMFAFCIYDTRSRELFLVRDYFGIKPLYYSKVGNGKFAFSSELKALASLPEIKNEVNRKALVSSINYLWIYGNESILNGIEKVPPAHYLRIDLGNPKNAVSTKRYWQINIGLSSISEDQLTQKLKELLEASIKRHLIADVPVGAFLSGGLDSSLISAIAKRYNSDLTTYTISMRKEDKDIESMPEDSIFAKKVAGIFDISHTDIEVNPSAVDSLTDMVYNLDEPIGDPAAINTYLICKAARANGIKVLLSGMGADEIFAGYRRQYATLLANRLNSLPLFLKNFLKTIVRPIPVRSGKHGMRHIRWAKRFLSFLDMDISQAYMRSYSYYDKNELRNLFNNQFDREIDQMYEYHNGIFYEADGLDDINRMCYTDINMFMSGLNLAYTDRASMAASVEVRVPFIDRELIEFAMSVKGRFKIDKNVSKYILKKAASCYLPKDIAYRPKASFSMPIRSWISNDLKDMVDDMLSEAAIKKRGLLNPQLVRKIIEDDRKGIEDNAYRIYQFLTLEIWFKRFIDG